MPALSVFVFQCGDSTLHALTLYRSGDNLPSDACDDHWIYRARLLMTRQSIDTLPLDSDAAIEALKRDGFYLAALGSGLITISQ